MPARKTREPETSLSSANGEIELCDSHDVGVGAERPGDSYHVVSGRSAAREYTGIVGAAGCHPCYQSQGKHCRAKPGNQQTAATPRDRGQSFSSPVPQGQSHRQETGNPKDHGGRQPSRRRSRQNTGRRVFDGTDGDRGSCRRTPTRSHRPGGKGTRRRIGQAAARQAD